MKQSYLKQLYPKCPLINGLKKKWSLKSLYFTTQDLNHVFHRELPHTQWFLTWMRVFEQGEHSWPLSQSGCGVHITKAHNCSDFLWELILVSQPWWMQCFKTVLSCSLHDHLGCYFHPKLLDLHGAGAAKLCMSVPMHMPICKWRELAGAMLGVQEK